MQPFNLQIYRNVPSNIGYLEEVVGNVEYWRCQLCQKANDTKTCLPNSNSPQSEAEQLKKILFLITAKILHKMRRGSSAFFPCTTIDKHLLNNNNGMTAHKMHLMLFFCSYKNPQ